MTHVAEKARLLRRVRRVVVKVGSNVLAGPTGIRAATVRALARDIAAIADGGRQVVLVSSGAVAAGAPQLGGRRRELVWRQAAAAVGQPTLMAAYQRAFRLHDRVVAQVLLSYGDLHSTPRAENARHTFHTLLRMGVIPIVNENDTVAVEELRFGDNDNLSALTATSIDADLLVILSDVDGVYTSDPRLDRGATIIDVAPANDRRFHKAGGPSRSGVGTGGMASKLAAAQKAAHAGISTIIASGRRRGTLSAVFDPTVAVGTLIVAR